MNNDKISADLLREEIVTMGAKPLQDNGSVTEWNKSSFEETHEKKKLMTRPSRKKQ